MKAPYYILLTFLLLLPIPVLGDSVFDVLNETYQDTGRIQSFDAVPSIEWEYKGESKAWIDIVGFRDVVLYNGVQYIPDSPKDCTIVKYDAVNIATRPTYTKTSLIIKEFPDKGEVTAYLVVTAGYKVKRTKVVTILGHSRRIPYYVYKTSIRVYTDTEKYPVRYNSITDEDSKTAYVTIYNNSINPHTMVYVPDNPVLVKKKYEYNNTESWEYSKIGFVDLTPKNVKYLNVSDCKYWIFNTRAQESNITKLKNSYVIPKALNPYEVNNSLDITLYDFYGESVKVDNFKIVQINSDPKNMIHIMAFFIILILGVLFLGISKNIGVLI